MIDERKEKAKKFVEYWENIGENASEKQNSSKFWLTLLTDVYDVKDVKSYIFFEEEVMLDRTSFIDGYIPTTRVLIEQKSS